MIKCLFRHNIINHDNFLIKRLNHYQTLNVAQNATNKEIKESYYKLSKKYHPDVNKHPTAEAKFKEIQEAYYVLGDELRKIEYDRKNEESYTTHQSDTSSPFAQHRVNIRFNKTRWRAKPERKNGSYTKPYDFDEFYRMHYNDYLKRRQNEMEYESFVRENYRKPKVKVEVDDDLKYSFLSKLTFILSFTFFLFSVYHLKELKRTEDENLRLKSLKHKQESANK